MKETSNAIHGIIIVFAHIIIMLALLALILGEVLLPDERTYTDVSTESYNEGWVWVDEEGNETEITPPVQLNLTDGFHTVTLKKTITCWQDRDCFLNFNSAKQDIYAYVDGQLRYSYTTKDTRPFGSSSTDIELFIPLHPDDNGHELTIVMEGDNNYTGVITSMSLGTQMEITFGMMGNENNLLMGALILLFMGVLSVILGVFIKISYKRQTSIGYLGIGVFFAGLWMLAESNFRQFMVPNFSMFSNMTYISILIIPMAFALYFDSLQKGRYRIFYMLICVLSIVETLVGFMLQINNQADLVETLPYSFALIGADIVVYAITVIPDIIHGYVKEYWLEFIGIIGAAICGVATIISYEKKPENIDGRILCIGFVFVIIMAYIRAFNTTLSLERSVNAAHQAQNASYEFLARMSHEMRTPINAILGMNKMILKESNDSTILDYARDVNSAGNYLLSVVDEVLDLSKVTSGVIEIEPVEYNLMDMIRECYNLVVPRTKASRLAFSVEMDDALPEVLYGDRERVVQIITNLLTNAAKYTPEGHVILKVNGRISEGKLLLIIEVEDTGVGIAEENLDFVFDSFKRVGSYKEEHIEGTGLGLSITKRLVDAMGGTIKVDSILGKGSVFTVIIPQQIGSIEPCGSFSLGPNGDRRVAPRDEKVTFNGRILVVDDVAINLRVFEMLLKDSGLHLEFAKSGPETLEKVTKTKYDIIFLDHLMPGMDGIKTKATMDSLKDNLNKDTPVIMQTANAVVGAKEKYINLGFADYISKPIKEEVLLAMLKKYLYY